MAVVNRPLFLDSQEFTPEGEATLLGKVNGLDRGTSAGFTPTTHQEKNQAFELLDYEADHQADRLLPQKRLQEIFVHQMVVFRNREYPGQKLSGTVRAEAAEYAQRALLSIGLEWGDYLLNAQKTGADLNAISGVVDDCPNPKAPLLDEIDADHPGIPALVRFLDLTSLRENGFPRDFGFDPMHTIVRRIESADSPELRHKFIEDPYTTAEPAPAVKERIAETAKELTIGALRKVMPRADSAQYQRAAFWQERLREMHKHHLAGRPAAALALQEAGLSVR